MKAHSFRIVRFFRKIMALEQNDLIVSVVNGFVKLEIYGNGGNDNRSVGTFALGVISAKKQNSTNPSIIEFRTNENNLIRGENFSKIKDTAGVEFGVDIDSAITAILTLIAPTSGGGGGSATAANQALQITEAQNTNTKLDITNTRLLSMRTGIDATIFQTSSGQYVVRRETLDGAGNVTVIWCDLNGTIIPTPSPLPIPMSAQEYTLRDDILHTAVNNGAGYSVGDTIIETQVLRLNVSPSQIISSLWYNATTNQPISQPSPATDIQVIVEVGLAKELTQLNIQNNTAPQAITANYIELSQLGQNSITISDARYIKIERPQQHGSAGQDQVTVTDVQGAITELFQGDVVEFPPIFNYTYGQVVVQSANSLTIIKITYSK